MKNTLHKTASTWHQTRFISHDNNKFIEYEGQERVVIEVERITYELRYVFFNAKELVLGRNVKEFVFDMNEADDYGYGVGLKSLPKVEEIIIDPLNTSFNLYNGMLYDKKYETLLFVPTNKEYKEIEFHPNLKTFHIFA